ncbi:MAG TPA: ABC transporter transmembrane domain-containing protein [Oligoflexia bacterium]|nr:ABC transporter transmembrane domain-containing protein [Oligoflexia bacterium]HMP47328.1 ABC transporter transmembrane domain-containing protein [Oligoflexia bacterium]
MSSHPSPIPQGRARFDPVKFKQIAPRLLRLLALQKVNILIGLLGLLGGSLINLSLPYLLRNFLNESTLTDMAPRLGIISIGVGFLFIIQGLCFYIRHYYLHLVGLNVVVQLKAQLMKSLLAQEISFFDSARLGDLLSRLSDDTQKVQQGVSTNISVILRYSIQVLGGVLFMLYLSSGLTSILILLIPLLVIFSMFWGKKLKLLSREVQERLAEANISAEEAISSIRVVKIFSSENKEQHKFEKSINEAFKTSAKRTHIAAVFSSSMVTLLHISIAVLFYFGISQVISQKLSFGDLSGFMLYCTIVAVSFGFLVNAWAEFVQSIGAAERVYEIIDRKPLIQNSNETQSIPPSTDLSIEFRNVSFKYSSRPDQLTLSNISFRIDPGTTVALVGPSGSGKSTIAALIPRLYDPSEGEVLISGIPVSKIRIEDLRKQIAFVPQNPQLFSSSLRENLTYGCDEVSEKYIIEVIEKCALSELLSRLPNGMETKIGDKGVQLSGGERQRVSIARALLRDPAILILDEATSSLDSHNEQAIQIALQSLIKNRTTLVIAHRLSTVKHAERVMVLKDGHIIEQGNHNSLMAEGGLYASLVEFQLISSSG